MKYLLLDTNIYLDLITERDKSGNHKAYDYLIKVLEFDTAKLIIPSIVKHEVLRKYESQIRDMRETFKSLKKSINEIYWVSDYDEKKEDIDNSIKLLKKNINKINDIFERNFNNYISKAEERLNTILKHPNIIELEETEKNLTNIMRRKAYQLRPFHTNDKESYADALIAEMLIDIGENIIINKDDQVYFITNNAEDFSVGIKGDKRHELHQDILKNIEVKKYPFKVEYRTLFMKFISTEFKDEFDKAEEIEDLVNYTQLEEERVHDEERTYFMEMCREMSGLELLPNADTVLDRISESDEVIELIDLLTENINKLIYEYEELYREFDERARKIQNIGNSDLIKLSEKYNQESDIIQIDIYDDNDVSSAIIDVIISEVIDEDTISYCTENSSCEDHFNIGLLGEFTDLHRNNYSIKVEGMIDPEDYGYDEIRILLLKNQKVISESFINIDYGGVEFDEEGLPYPGSEMSIHFNLESILNAIDREFTNLFFNIDKKSKQIILFTDKFL